MTVFHSILVISLETIVLEMTSSQIRSSSVTTFKLVVEKFSCRCLLILAIIFAKQITTHRFDVLDSDEETVWLAVLVIYDKCILIADSYHYNVILDLVMQSKVFASLEK